MCERDVYTHRVFSFRGEGRKKEKEGLGFVPLEVYKCVDKGGETRERKEGGKVTVEITRLVVRERVVVVCERVRSFGAWFQRCCTLWCSF